LGQGCWVSLVSQCCCCSLRDWAALQVAGLLARVRLAIRVEQAVEAPQGEAAAVARPSSSPLVLHCLMAHCCISGTFFGLLS